MRLALREPLIDPLNLHLREVSGLRGRQHLAIKPAHGAVCGQELADDAFLLDNSDLNSSSLYCGHLEVVVESGLSPSCGVFRAQANYSMAHAQVWKKMGNKSENYSEIVRRIRK